MQVRTITVGLFEMNCYALYTDDKKECILIDPGDEPKKIISELESEGLKPNKIFLTHCHIDHARGSAEVQKHFDIPLYLGEEDIPLLESLNDQARMFGMEQADPPNITAFFNENNSFEIGGKEIKVFHTPGHSPGSFCILAENHLFAGDVLFFDSIGRTDLYGGSYPQLMSSIQTKLMNLPDDTFVYPGHGPGTTIGRERNQNPFLNQR